MKAKDIYKILAIGLILYGLIYGLIITLPASEMLGQSSRNLFYHVPLWFAVIAMMGISVYHSVYFLLLSDPDRPVTTDPLLTDVKAQTSASVGVLFTVLGLVTGIVWSRVTWGSSLVWSDFSAWWIWDPIQVCALVGLLIYLAYFLLRSSFSEPTQRAKAAAVYNIFAFATLIPLFFIIPKMLDGAHPTANNQGSFIFNKGDINNSFRIILYPMMLGFILLGIWLYELRSRAELLHVEFENYVADSEFVNELHSIENHESN